MDAIIFRDNTSPDGNREGDIIVLYRALHEKECCNWFVKYDSILYMTSLMCIYI